MTSKELLYIQDALSHQKFFKQKFKETAQKLSDNELSNYVTQLESRQNEIFNQFYNLV